MLAQIPLNPSSFTASTTSSGKGADLPAPTFDSLLNTALRDLQQVGCLCLELWTLEPTQVYTTTDKQVAISCPELQRFSVRSDEKACFAGDPIPTFGTFRPVAPHGTNILFPKVYATAADCARDSARWQLTLAPQT